MPVNAQELGLPSPEDLVSAMTPKPSPDWVKSTLHGTTEEPVPDTFTLRENDDHTLLELAANIDLSNEFDTKREGEILRFAASQHKLKPGEFLEAQKYAAVLPHIPVEVIADNLESVRNIYRYQIDFAKTVKEHPVLAKFIGDPRKGAEVMADTAALKGIENIFGKYESIQVTDPETGETRDEFEVIAGPLAPFRQSLRNGLDSVHTQLLGFIKAWDLEAMNLLDPKYLVPLAAKLADATDIDEAKGILNEALKEQRALYGEHIDYLTQRVNGAQNIYGDLTHLGTAARFITESATEAIEMIPFLAANVGITALTAGAGAGMPIAIAANMMFDTMQSTGSIYSSLKDYKDPVTGLTMDEGTAKLAARIGGAVAGAAGAVPGTALAMDQLRMAGIVRDATVAAVTKALTPATLTRLGVDFLGHIGTHTLRGAATIATFSAIEAASQELAKASEFGAASANPEVIAQAAFQSFTTALRTLPFLVSWAPARHAMERVGQFRRAEANAKVVDAILKGEDASKLAKGNRDLYEEFVRRASNNADGNPKTAYIAKHLWDEAANRLGLDPKTLHAEVMGDKGAAYEEATRAKSGDITIPIEKLGRLARSPELSDFAVREVRLYEQDISIGERFRIQVEQIAKLEELAQNDKVFAKGMETVRKDIEDNVRRLLERSEARRVEAGASAGFREQNFEKIIKFHQELFFGDVVATWSAMEGRYGDLENFYKKYYKDVQFIDADRVETENVIAKMTPRARRYPDLVAHGTISRVASLYTPEGNDIDSHVPAASGVFTSLPIEVHGRDYSRQRNEISVFSNSYVHTLAHEWMHMQAHLKARLYNEVGPEGPRAFVDRYKHMLSVMEMDHRYKADFLDLNPEELKKRAAREEKLAHLFEAYLLQGRVPPDSYLAELIGDFGNIMRTLDAQSREYGTVEKLKEYVSMRLGKRPALEDATATMLQYAGAEVSLNQRAIEYFDSILTAGAAVDHAAHTLNSFTMDAVIKDLDPKTAERYARYAETVRENASAIVVEMVQRARRTATGEMITDKATELRTQLTEALRQDRGYRLLKFLSDRQMWDPADIANRLPPMKFSELEVRQHFGAHGDMIVSTLRAKFPDIFAKESDTVFPLSDAATIFEFDTVEAMMTKIVGLRKMDELIQSSVEAELRALYGVAYKPDAAALARAALGSMVHNRALFEKSLIELRWLAARLDPSYVRKVQVMSDGSMRHLAREVLLKRSYAGLKPELFLNYERAAGERAFIAIEKGDFAEAFAQKEAQVFNQLLYGAAVEKQRWLKDNLQRVKDNARSDFFRGQLGLADPSYRDLFDQVAGVLRRANDVPPDLSKVDAFFSRVLAHLQGEHVIFDAEGLKEVLTRAFERNPSVEDTEALVLVANNIRALAKNLNEIRLGERTEAVAAVRKNIIDDLKKLPVQPRAPLGGSQRPSILDRWKRGFQAVDALLLDPELMIEMMGKTAYDSIFKPYLESRYREEGMFKDTLNWFVEKWSKPGADLDKLTGKIIDTLDDELPLPPEVLAVRGGKRDHSWLWMLALNMGNRENRQRLLDGYGWREEQVLAALDKHLSAKEWDFIEEVWKFLDANLWPAIVDKENRMVGLEPRKVEATPFTLSSGREIRGGYFPLRYDPLSKKSVEKRVEEQMRADFKVAPTAAAHSHTYTRVKEYTDVVRLDWGVVPAHVRQVIHDVSFGEYLRDMRLLMKDAELQAVLRNHLGDERTETLLHWFQSIAMNGSDPVAPHQQTILNNVLGTAKKNMVTTVVGFSIPVVAADILNPSVAAVFGAISPKYLVQASLKAPIPAYFKEANGKSRELQSRRARWRQNYAELLAQPGEDTLVRRRGIGGMHDRIREAGFFFMEQLDKLTSTQIWWAKYSESTGKGIEEMEAREVADRAVRKALPGGTLLEKPAILRDRKTLAMLVMFYGWFSKTYNMSRGLIHEPWMEFANADEPGRKLSSATKLAATSARLAAALVFTTIMGDYFSGRGRENDETWGEYFSRKALASPFNTLPLVGGLAEHAANVVVTGRSKQMSLRQAPALALMQVVADDVGKIMSDNKQGEDKAIAAMHLLMTATGLPANQTKRTVQYLSDLNELGNQGPLDVASGLLYGERRSSTPMTDAQKILEGRNP